MRTLKHVLLALLVVAFYLLLALAVSAKQTQPDKKRTLEIQHALVDHDYIVHLTGKWDLETIAMLKSIAKENNWQTKHVPDARVLILIGLGNKYSNPEVLNEHHNHLDNKGNTDEAKLEESRCIHRFVGCPGWTAGISLSGRQGGIRQASHRTRGRESKETP